MAAILVRKVADESVVSSATLQDDNDLQFAIAANEVWCFEIYVNVLGGTSSDFKCAIQVPSGATLRWSGLGGESVIDHQTEITSDATTVWPTSGLTDPTQAASIFIKGTVVNAGNSGSVKFRWAQNASNATATIVKAGSYIVAQTTT